MIVRDRVMLFISVSLILALYMLCVIVSYLILIQVACRLLQLVSFETILVYIMCRVVLMMC